MNFSGLPRSGSTLLGAILINNNAFYRVISLVDTEDFFKDAHRSIFSTMRALAEQSREIRLRVMPDRHDLAEAADHKTNVAELERSGAVIAAYRSIMKRVSEEPAS